MENLQQQLTADLPPVTPAEFVAALQPPESAPSSRRASDFSLPATAVSSAAPGTPVPDLVLRGGQGGFLREARARAQSLAA